MTMLNSAPSFGQLHFGRAPLRDQRRTNRLIHIADQCLEHPEESLPNKLQDPAMYEAAGRLMRTPAVNHESVLQTHKELTLHKMRERSEVLLVIHDDTDLDFTSKKSLEDQLGFLGDGTGHGYMCHNTLVVEPQSRDVLGLANQILHRRVHADEDETPEERKEKEERETLLWLRGAQAVGKVPEGKLWVDICDRAADTFEFLDYEHQAGKSYVIRAKHNRCIMIGHQEEGESSLLFDHIRSQAAVGKKDVYVQAQNGHAARWAQCRVSMAPVQIKPPQFRRGNHGDALLATWVIRIWEVDAPANVKEPLEWILLSNVPVDVFEDALERIEWYELRWVAEEYHKVQKTGCGIEKLQFKDQHHLEPMIALLSVVAVQLLNVRSAAQDESRCDKSATDYVSPLHVSTLSIYRYQEDRPLSVREFYLALARLGGHAGRKTRPPGWQVLWRGWRKLQQMVDYELARRTTQIANRSPPEK